jgi:phage/plasmid-associated DNA primase
VKTIKGKDVSYAKHKTHTIYWGNDAQQYVLDSMKKKKHTFRTSFQYEGLERHCSFKTEQDGSTFLKAMTAQAKAARISLGPAELVESSEKTPEPVEDSEETSEPMEKPQSVDKHMSLTEVFDKHRLNHIVQNKEHFKSKMREKCFDDSYDPFNIAETYLGKSVNGKISVTYRQKQSFGRFCAKGSLSLQCLAREIRHSISGEHYDDIDCVNAHPVILEFLCKKYGFPHEYLSKYNKDRERYLKELDVGRDTAKMTFLSLTNGGSKAYNALPDRSEFITNYKNEMEAIHKAFASANKEDFEKHQVKRKASDKKYNHEASYMNTLLCHFENKILMSMFEFYKKPNDSVLCFDGIMVRKGMKPRLKACENYVFEQLGIKIRLKIKEMDEGFSFAGRTVEPFDDVDDAREAKYNQLLKDMCSYGVRNDITDNTIAIMFHAMVGDDLVVVNDFGDGFKWNSDKMLWERKPSGGLMQEICNEKNLILKAVRTWIEYYSVKCESATEKSEIGKAGSLVKTFSAMNHKIQSTRGMKDVFTLAKSNFKDAEFRNKINRSHDLFPLPDGKVLDLRDSSIRKRTRSDMFSFECNVRYIPREEWTEEDVKDHEKFVHQIFMEDPEYIAYQKVKLGSYLSGRNVRDIDINYGKGRNGKSTWVTAWSLIMGEFFGLIQKEIIVYDPKAHKSRTGNGHKSHLMPIDGKRLIITQELEDGEVLNGEMAKKIASCDPIEGVRECYGRETFNLYPFCKLCILTNVIPKIDVSDLAQTDRVNFNPYQARFMDPVGLEKEKETGLYDPVNLKYYEADNDLIDKYKVHGRNIDILFSWLVEGCKEFYKVRKDGIKKPKIVRDFNEEKIGENDLVQQWIDDDCSMISVEKWEKLADKTQWETLNKDLYEKFSEWAVKNECHSGIGKIRFYKGLDLKTTNRRAKKGKLYQRIRFSNNGYDSGNDSADLEHVVESLKGMRPDTDLFSDDED